MRIKLESVGTVAVIIAALAVTFSSLRNKTAPLAATSAAGMPEPRQIPDWRELIANGIVIGSPTAPIQIIELADFECPFCARMEQSIQALKEKLGADLAVTFIHHPLPGHRFAVPAARVAECAEKQGRFAEMRDLLYAKQDSLGIKSWQQFAADARIADTSNFRTCSASNEPIPRVNAGLALGEKLQIRGTPTLIINGWLYYGLQPGDLEKEVNLRRTSGS